MTFLMGGGGGLIYERGRGAYIRDVNRVTYLGSLYSGDGGGGYIRGILTGFYGMLFGRPTKVRKLNNIIKKNSNTIFCI